MEKLTLTFATALICVIFLNLCNLCFAQDTKDSVVAGNYKNEIGIHIWRSSPWLISYKRYVKANKAIRIGVGGGINNFDLSVTSTVNYKNPPLSKRFSNYSRLGFEWHKNISQKLYFYYGIDITFFYFLTVTESKYSRDPSVTVKKSNKDIYGGLAPVAGLKFTLNSRISFSTEVLPMVLFYYRLQETTYSDPNYFDRNRNTKTTGINFALYSAGAIYLNLHF